MEAPVVSPLGCVRWDRGAATEPSARVSLLWASGFIADRSRLRASLGIEGSDAELAASLYARDGLEAPRRIAGPLAWIVWDGTRRRLVAVRDRLGLEPLYWLERGGAVLVGGSVDAVVRESGRRPSLDLRSVAAQIHGEAPPPGATIYEEVRAVEPGCALVVTPERVEVLRYWRIEPRPLLELPDDDAYAEAFRSLFSSVAAEYLPGGPVGITVSGGLDSTTLAATIRETSPETPLTAFCWQAPELPEADESALSEAVCRRLDLPRVAIRADLHWPLGTPLRPSPDGPFHNVYTDLWEATYRRVAGTGTRCLFTGYSGDHLVGGNVFSYPDLLLTGRWRRLLRELAAHRPHSEIGLARILRHMVIGPALRFVVPGPGRRPSSAPWLGERLRAVERPMAAGADRWLLPGRRQRLAALRDPLIPMIAAAANAQAAAHGVELRHPWLDHRLVELAAALPATQTFAAGRRKIIVRNAMRGRLPDEVLDRPGKIYPSAIAERGLRERETATVEELLTGMRAARLGFVDERRLREAYRAYRERRSASALFWHALTLEAWLRAHVEP